MEDKDQQCQDCGGGQMGSEDTEDDLVVKAYRDGVIVRNKRW